MTDLDRIQKRLRPGCHVRVEHDPVADDWRALIVTEQNRYPHWVGFHGLTADMAVAGLLAFLRGNAPDSAYRPRPAKEFLLDGEKP